MSHRLVCGRINSRTGLRNKYITKERSFQSDVFQEFSEKCSICLGSKPSDLQISGGNLIKKASGLSLFEGVPDAGAWFPCGIYCLAYSGFSGICRAFLFAKAVMSYRKAGLSFLCRAFLVRERGHSGVLPENIYEVADAAEADAFGRHGHAYATLSEYPARRLDTAGIQGNTA